jgi:hypothetical protein
MQVIAPAVECPARAPNFGDIWRRAVKSSQQTPSSRLRPRHLRNEYYWIERVFNGEYALCPAAPVVPILIFALRPAFSALFRLCPGAERPCVVEIARANHRRATRSLSSENRGLQCSETIPASTERRYLARPALSCRTVDLEYLNSVDRSGDLAIYAGRQTPTHSSPS